MLHVSSITSPSLITAFICRSPSLCLIHHRVWEIFITALRFGNFLTDACFDCFSIWLSFRYTSGIWSFTIPGLPLAHLLNTLSGVLMGPSRVSRKYSYCVYLPTASVSIMTLQSESRSQMPWNRLAIIQAGNLTAGHRCKRVYGPWFFDGVKGKCLLLMMKKNDEIWQRRFFEGITLVWCLMWRT